MVIFKINLSSMWGQKQLSQDIVETFSSQNKIYALSSVDIKAAIRLSTSSPTLKQYVCMTVVSLNKTTVYEAFDTWDTAQPTIICTAVIDHIHGLFLL